MTNKSKALHNFEDKKNEIRERLSASRQIESPRGKQVRETNEKSAKQGLMIRAKARHERRHENAPRTSRSQALERNNLYSKER